MCAERDNKVYVLNTRDMVLHCLDVDSRQWAEKMQVDTSYRAKFAATTYSNGRLYISGGCELDGETQNAMISVAVGGDGKSRLPIQQQPNMLYKRHGHGMAGVEGRILVCGGCEDTVHLANTEVFDLRTGTWSRHARSQVIFRSDYH